MVWEEDVWAIMDVMGIRNLFVNFSLFVVYCSVLGRAHAIMHEPP
jgi:hypothetical protein